VDLAGQHGAHQQRVDQVVRVVDAEEDRPSGGHALGVPDLDGLEEEPQPESCDPPDGGVEAVGRLDRRHVVRKTKGDGRLPFTC
jgi:hypothetical protein